MPLLRSDPFAAVMLASVPLEVSEEQKMYVKEILNVACSDSRFAEKAYIAISRVLMGLPTKIPIISSLTPNSAEIGDPSFTLHVHGQNFTSTSVIVFNGGEESTTFVGPTELTTGVDMTTATTPIAVPVAVRDMDVQSEPLMFTFTDGSTVAARSVKKEDVKKEDVRPVEKVTPKESVTEVKKSEK
jgi:hypothetical protein